MGEPQRLRCHTLRRDSRALAENGMHRILRTKTHMKGMGVSTSHMRTAEHTQRQGARFIIL
jgi:hypothetical protein